MKHAVLLGASIRTEVIIKDPIGDDCASALTGGGDRGVVRYFVVTFMRSVIRVETAGSWRHLMFA